jgi:glycosidase
VEDVVMYQVNPRVFAPNQSFNAVGRHLDSIQALGINVMWFMPINEVGQEKSVNSPYCVKNYKGVNPEFGTREEFKALVDSCHQRGIHVIIDWVANHTSWDNAWIDHKEWYTKDAQGNIISPAGTGWDDVADLDFDNQEMRLAMIDAMKFWVTEIGIDGFRCDAADFVPFDFWKQTLDSLRAIPDHPLLMLAEGKRRDHFDAGFDMNYSWDFLNTLREVWLKDAPATDLFATDKAEYDTIPVGKVKLRFTTNHDETAKMSPVQEFGNERGSMAAFVLTAYLHGGALIYGSQEMGYPDPINFFTYVPVDWTTNSAVYQEYKQLMALYNQYPAIRKGTMVSYPNDDVLLFEKQDGEERLLVAVNVRNRDVNVTLPPEWASQPCNDLYADSETQLSTELSLSAYQYRILTKLH